MKKRFIYSAIMALAVATGCIKEQGEEAYLITRKDIVDTKKYNKDKPQTLISDENGYMVGVAVDTVVMDTFLVEIKNRVAVPDVYVELRSLYSGIDTARNAVRSVGYVYSQKNHMPVITDDENCKIVATKDISANVDSTMTEFTFTGKCKDLNFNSTYYIRSYIETTKGVTVYSPYPVVVKTILPHDIWFKRNSTMGSFTNRQDCFSCTIGEDVYIYGGRSGNSAYFDDMWKYDKSSDTWEQLSVCTHHDAKRSNGAMFAYEKGDGDILLYIVCGEKPDGDAYQSILYYSIENRRYCNEEDHPNHSRQEVVKTQDGATIYQLSNGTFSTTNDGTGSPYSLGVSTAKGVHPIYENDNIGGLKGCLAFTLDILGEKQYYVAFGKNSKEGIDPNIYRYEVTDDCGRTTYSIDENGKLKPGTVTYGFPWVTVGTNLKDKNTEALYQPICQTCGDRVVIGTGESSMGGYSKKFYMMTAKSINELNVRELTTAPDDFEPRANAASFYLNYTKNGDVYDRLYVGTGRTGSEGSEDLLGDLWCFDFSTSEWIRCSDCSNLLREGAIGFSVTRNDDRFSNDLEENARGIFSFGRGRTETEAISKALNDTWEYLP